MPKRTKNESGSLSQAKGGKEWTLLLGDGIKMLEEMEESSVDLILTDPPYGHKNNDGDLISTVEKVQSRGRYHDYKASESEILQPRPILNDGEEANDLYRKMLVQAKRVLKKGGGVCCCCCGGGGGPDPQFARWSMWMDEALTFNQMIVWDKGPLGLGWQYHRSYETVLVGYKGTKCNWYDTSKRVENIIRPIKYGVKKIIPGKDHHPTEKPIMLAEFFIENHTRPGDLVVDPFTGRGWAGVASLRTGRRFIGSELDPHWYSLAKERLTKAAKIGIVPKHERGSAF